MKIVAFVTLLAWFFAIPCSIAGLIKFISEISDHFKGKYEYYGSTPFLIIALVSWAWILSR